MRHWYVVHAQAHGETRALKNLERQDYEAWLPLYKKKRRHAGRVEMVHRPLFPRYLFVRVDMEVERWRPILSTFGVSRLVGGLEGPQPIGDDVVEGLKDRAGEDGLFDLGLPRLKDGDPVRISDGPLADLEGIFQAENDAERVLVLLKLMGREVKVTVASANIEAL